MEENVEMKCKFTMTLMLLMQFLSLFSFIEAQVTSSNPDGYKNMRFWDIEVGRCFVYQKTSNSCVPASIQMVFRYLDFSPLPNQTQLANEMHTDINHTTEWRFTYIPFKNRGFSEYYNGSLSSDFSKAISYLKGNISRNFPAIVRTWYDEQAKSEGKITHARVITGYNSTGIFFHDPWIGPNEYLSYSAFSDLWNDAGYRAFIVKQEPRFDLFVEVKDWFGNSVPEVRFTLVDKINRTEVTNSSGIAKFSNLTVANYSLGYSWRFQSEEEDIILTRQTSKNYRVFFSDVTILIITVISLVIIAMILLINVKRVYGRYPQLSRAQSKL